MRLVFRVVHNCHCIICMQCLLIWNERPPNRKYVININSKLTHNYKFDKSRVKAICVLSSLHAAFSHCTRPSLIARGLLSLHAAFSHCTRPLLITRGFLSLHAAFSHYTRPSLITRGLLFNENGRACLSALHSIGRYFTRALMPAAAVIASFAKCASLNNIQYLFSHKHLIALVKIYHKKNWQRSSVCISDEEC